MRIIFTIDTLAGGGAETSTLQLIKHLIKEHDITVVYFYKNHELLSGFKDLPIQVNYMDLNGKYSFITGIQKLIKLIRDLHPDLIVTTLYRASIISRFAALITRTTLIDTMVSDSYGKAKQNEFSGFSILKYLLVYRLDRMTSFIPKMWISNSRSIANSMGKSLRISNDKIKVIYRGRDATDIPQWQQPVTQDYFRFVAVGRLTAAKDYITMLKAFQLLSNHQQNVHLTIYGEGPLRLALEDLILELGIQHKVSLSGRVNAPYKSFHLFHCYLLSSTFEGFSGALVEAMMTGIPMIVSDIPMNLEALNPCLNSYIHKVSDVEDLYFKMKVLLENYPQAIEIGMEAKKFALEHFDLEKTATDYNTFLKLAKN